ncbi:MULTISPECIES: hypothetical protein [Xanthomonas]|uniref:Uncharacterized protein n=1 Tax=Xanthomonas dyei TaxID=743699 RepID=A0ABZ0D3Q1_9XANT|nr:hypothetical protein [Xanthomonas dyei]WOB24776.1 hypothetical protein NYR99_13300 [Xanthomonas dyei]WOB52404.1 hypothetical protein NYR95_13305 [Xanthomonas dyei]
MALAHHYHPLCGCFSCCQQELADERADELALALHSNGNVLSDAIGEMTGEQFALMAARRADGNAEGVIEILSTAVSDYLSQLINGRMDDVDCSRIEAVQHYLTVYEAKPAPVAVQPWRVAA